MDTDSLRNVSLMLFFSAIWATVWELAGSEGDLQGRTDTQLPGENFATEAADNLSGQSAGAAPEGARGGGETGEYFYN